jgi:creatinine amidohydrolase/Fe(II)-dependent formamide hydrolase-like protein
MRATLLLLSLFTLAATPAVAQQPPAGAAGQQPPRRSPDAPRTIEGVNTVWIEQLTRPELRDLIKDGYTTVLVMTGGVEDNSANLVLDKHNINNRLHGEMIARRLGRTLVAPLVTLEPGNVGSAITPGRAGPMISQATYRALLFDIGNYLRSMGFKEIYYLGDSGGNAGGMRFAADSLTTLYANDTAGVVFKHVAEYYNHTSHVQPFIQNELKIPEQIRIGASTGSSGLHEELAIDATMALVDPVSIRYPQRVKAGEAEINGVKFESLEWLQEIGRKVAELRTTLTVDAITAYRATIRKP